MSIPASTRFLYELLRALKAKIGISNPPTTGQLLTYNGSEVEWGSQIDGDFEVGTFSATGATRGTIIPAAGGYIQMSNTTTGTYQHLTFFNTNGHLGTISTGGNDFKIESEVDSMTVESADNLYLVAPTNIRLNCTSIIIDAGSLASNLQVGNYSTSGAGYGGFLYDDGRHYQSAATTSTWTLQAFFNPNGLVGRIRIGGTTTFYLTSSDYRLKENFKPIVEPLKKLNQIPIYEFNFKTDKKEKIMGVVAHELDAIIPQAVSGEKDAVDEEGNIDPQGVDYSQVVPLLVASVQELSAKVEKLENEVKLLKGE